MLWLLWGSLAAAAGLAAGSVLPPTLSTPPALRVHGGGFARLDCACPWTLRRVYIALLLAQWQQRPRRLARRAAVAPGRPPLSLSNTPSASPRPRARLAQTCR